jgi:DNA-binding CsgD family transcriptional regulator
MAQRTEPDGLQTQLAALGIDLPAVLENSAAPVGLVNPAGVVLWQNAAAVALVGDQRGRRMTAIAKDYLPRARAALTRKRMGADRLTHTGVVLVDSNGERQHAETISLSLTKDDQLVAILAIVKSVTAEDSTAVEPLSPRQRETLSLLAAGLTTAQIATELGVAHETARNHIRRVIRALGVHSRLAAVARSRELGLLGPHDLYSEAAP